MQIGHTESDRGAVGRSGYPEVEILTALPCLEEEDDIARMEICKGVEKEIVPRLFLF